MAVKPRINLVGGGAVGSLLASALLTNEIPFTWVVRSAQRRENLGQFVIQCDGQAEALDTGLVHFVASVQNLPTSDWTLVAVKAHQVGEVLANLPSVAASQVLVVANGLHRGAHHLGLFYGGVRLAGSTLHVTPHSTLLLGALPGVSEEAPALVPWLTAPWLKCGANEVIAKRMWHKLCLNCVINPLSALLDRPNGELLAWADAPLVHRVITEVSTVAQSDLGRLWSYSSQSMHKAMLQLLTSTASNSSSMREDIHAKRETEISHLNLAVAELGMANAIACPMTHALGIMVEAVTNSASA